MGRKIIAYEANDGAIFDTEGLMLAHEASLEVQRVDRWIDAVGDWSAASPRGPGAWWPTSSPSSARVPCRRTFRRHS